MSIPLEEFDRVARRAGRRRLIGWKKGADLRGRELAG